MFVYEWPEWKNMDTIHLLINQRFLIDNKNPQIKDFDEEIIQTYNETYGEMCRDILKRIKSHIIK